MATTRRNTLFEFVSLMLRREFRNHGKKHHDIFPTGKRIIFKTFNISRLDNSIEDVSTSFEIREINEWMNSDEFKWIKENTLEPISCHETFDHIMLMSRIVIAGNLQDEALTHWLLLHS